MVVFLYLRVERVEQAFRPAACCIVGSAALAAEVRPSGAEAQHLSCLNAGLKPCSTPFSRAFRLFMIWLLSAECRLLIPSLAPIPGCVFKDRGFPAPPGRTLPHSGRHFGRRQIRPPRVARENQRLIACFQRCGSVWMVWGRVFRRGCLGDPSRSARERSCRFALTIRRPTTTHHSESPEPSLGEAEWVRKLLRCCIA